MKALLIFPPQAYPANPYLSVPLLAGQLKNAGYDVTTIDLNVKFFNDILNAKYLSCVYEDIKRIPQEIQNKIKSKQINEDQDCYKYLAEKQTLIQKYLESSSKKAEYAIKYVDQAVKTYKTQDFYNPDLFSKAFRIISYATDLISMKYFPMRINFGDYYNKYFTMNYKDILFQTSTNDINIYIDYYKEHLPSLNLNNYDIIFISVPYPNQIVAAFTLARYLRENTTAKLCIGGNTITRIAESFKKHKDFFSIFCNYILIGEAEQSIVDVMKYLDGEIDISSVSGLIYMKNGNIVSNPIIPYTNIDNSAEIYLDDYNFTDYFIPEIVLPIQIAKGCYWGKCAFCDFFHGKPTYLPKKIDTVIKEIEKAKEKYGIDKFEITDEAIPPEYYFEFADKLIEKQLNIKFFSMARLEDLYTKDNLQKLYKAGLRLLNWGYEAASERILKQMNKGINPKNRLTILKNSSDSLIWNRVSFIFGFPGETLEEGMMTVNTIKDNLSIIHSYNAMQFALRRHAQISKEIDKYDIASCSDNEEFSDNINITDKELKEEDKKNYIKKVREIYQQEHGTRLWRILMPTSFMLLYLSKYGRDFVKDCVIR